MELDELLSQLLHLRSQGFTKVLLDLPEASEDIERATPAPNSQDTLLIVQKVGW